MADRGLLGVGEGIVHLPWFGRQWRELQSESEEQEPTREATPEQSRQVLVEDEVPQEEGIRTRDSRIVKDSVTELYGLTKQVAEAVNLPSIPANSTSQVDVTITEADLVRAGDYVTWGGADVLNHGLVVQRCVPAPADDTIRMWVSNVTAAAIDAAATTFHWLVHHDA